MNNDTQGTVIEAKSVGNNCEVSDDRTADGYHDVSLRIAQTRILILIHHKMRCPPAYCCIS